MMDGMSYDQNFIDTTMQPAPPIDQPYHGNRFSGVGTEMAEGILREQLSDADQLRRPLGTGDGQTLGKFPFERE